MALNKAKTTQEKSQNSEAPLGAVWDKQSGPDENDGRANLQSGDKGKEPGGRWSQAYYERPAKIVGKNVVSDP